LRQRLANALRDQGDDSLADALDHGRVEVRGGILEIRSLPEYRVVLEMGLPAIQDVLAAVLPDKARATLGGDLGPGDSAAPGPDSTTISAPSRATAGAQRAAGAPEAVQRALADPEFQKIQKLFDGQIREVRNLRGYTA
jgi:hypothetical protein